jgi:hypothetical protein
MDLGTPRAHLGNYVVIALQQRQLRFGSYFGKTAKTAFEAKREFFIFSTDNPDVSKPLRTHPSESERLEHGFLGRQIRRAGPSGVAAFADRGGLVWMEDFREAVPMGFIKQIRFPPFHQIHSQTNARLHKTVFFLFNQSGGGLVTKSDRDKIGSG